LNPGVNSEPILSAVSAILVAGTVIVGIAGLYSDEHVKQGKLSRSGAAVPALMIVLGVGSVLPGVASRKVADRKAREESERRDAQFQRQMTMLRNVTNDLGTVRGSLRDSLRRQEHLYGVATRNLAEAHIRPG
jgi:hypothetical protein